MRGPSLVLCAAFLFAAANAVAKALYMRGNTLVSVFLARCLVVYLANGALVACREGQASAGRVLLLRTGSFASSQMAALRGLVGAMTGIGLNLAFVFLTLADAFTIFKGVDLLGTNAISRLALGEALSWRELGSGLLTLLGLLLVAQPPLLFGGAATAGARLSAAGIAAATLGGLCSAAFNVLTRALSREGRPLGAVSPAMLLSYFMVATFGCAGALGVGATASGLAARDGWAWARLASGAGAPLVALGLLALYCAGILCGQLAMGAPPPAHPGTFGRGFAAPRLRRLALVCAAKGMATTRAGVGAILAVSEIAFAFLLDVALLGETPPNHPTPLAHTRAPCLNAAPPRRPVQASRPAPSPHSAPHSSWRAWARWHAPRCRPRAPLHRSRGPTRRMRCTTRTRDQSPEGR